VRRRLARFALVALALAGLACAALAFVGWRRRRAEHDAKVERTLRALRSFQKIVDFMVQSNPDCRDTWPPPTDWPDDETGQMAFRQSIEGYGSDFEGELDGKGFALDGWGRRIHYRRPGLLHPTGWEVFSAGADGELDTPDDLVVGEDVAPITSAEQAARARADLERRLFETRDALEHLADIARDPLKNALPRANGDEDSAAILLVEGGARHFRDDMDGWSHALRYACPGPVHPNGWDVWSIGPNGIDERGRGDDVLIGEDIAPIKTSSR
jgi:hypothetical protein